MKFEMTTRHVARGARADAETYDRLHLLKSCSELKATYQIRLLLYRAIQEGKKLVLNIPDECKLHDDLKAMVKDHRSSIEVARR